MDAAHESLVNAKVAARKAAKELADLYITESARLKDSHGEHGLAAAIEFLESLRDNLIAIRPLNQSSDTPPAETNRMPESIEYVSRLWDESEVEEGFTLVEFNDVVKAETKKAVLIGNTWLPKSVLQEVPEEGDEIGEWPVRQWFVEKEMTSLEGN